jgi:hypothetical protein
MKQCVYHLHIPRTSGVLIREVLKNQKPESKIVSGHKNKILLSDFESANFISGHYGTSPIGYSQKTFAIIREPIERTFSCLKYIWSHFYSDISMSDFFELYLSDEKLSQSVSNQQSKFLTGPLDIDKYNKNIQNLKDTVESNWFIQSNPKSFNEIISSIDMNNIQIFDYSRDDTYSEISKIIGLDYNKMLFENKINVSPFMIKDMYSIHYDKIVKLNNLDLELYEYFKS